MERRSLEIGLELGSVLLEVRLRFLVHDESCRARDVNVIVVSRDRGSARRECRGLRSAMPRYRQLLFPVGDLLIRTLLLHVAAPDKA